MTNLPLLIRFLSFLLRHNTRATTMMKNTKKANITAATTFIVFDPVHFYKNKLCLTAFGIWKKKKKSHHIFSTSSYHLMMVAKAPNLVQVIGCLLH